MLFGRRKRKVKRILIVEDEPLVAFDNENMLGDHGYEIVATVDDYERAMEILDSEEEVHLILSDVRLKSDRTGLDLARHAKARGVPTLFATGHAHDGAHEVAVGCLMKPYSERQLVKAIECVDRHLQNQRFKAPKGLRIFVVEASSEE
jgi:CheY-like chemotaxis protein